MDAAAASAVAPAIAALGALPEIVAIVLIVALGALVAVVVFRLPAVADAVARIRGRGETPLEREQATEIHRLEAEVADLAARLRLMEHREEERSRFDRQRRQMLQAIVNKAECLVPDCRYADMILLLRQLASDQAWAIEPVAAGHD